MGGLREGLGRLGYRSVTHPEARPPAGRDLGALLAAMPLSSDRAVLARCCDFRSIRSARPLRTKPDCPAGTGLRDSRVRDRYLLCSDTLTPVAEDRPHFYVQTFGRRTR
jgi:hypothetical protein